MVQCIAPLLAVALFHIAQSQNSTDFTSCDAGIYKAGSKASVTCLFHEAINKDKNNGVVVYKRRLTASNDEQEEIVGTCHIKRDTEPKCSAKGGSDFIITKHGMTIVIPQVSLQHEGRYACHVVPGDGITVHECLLIVEGASQPNNVNDVHYSSEKTESLHKHVKATLALIILIPLAVGVIVFFVILAYKKHWFPFKKKREKQSTKEENVSMVVEIEPEPTDTTTVPNESVAQEATATPVAQNNPEMQDLQNAHKEGEEEVSLVKQTEGLFARFRRESREKKAKEAEEKRQEKERKDELKERLKKADSKKEKRHIQKEFDDNEKRLKQKK